MKVDENHGGAGGFAWAFPVKSIGRRNRLLHPSTACDMEFLDYGGGFETRLLSGS